MATAPVEGHRQPPTHDEPALVDPIGDRYRDAMIDDPCVQLVVSFPPVTMTVGDANALRAGQGAVA